MVTGALCALTACGSKKADEGGAEAASIVGEWKLDPFAYTFNEDGSGQYDAAGTVMKFTYETDGDKLSILYDGNTAPFETTYSISGDELNVKDSSGNDTIYKKVK